MPQTAPDALVYPDAAGHTRLWEHLANLANSVQAALATLRTQQAARDQTFRYWRSAALSPANGTWVTMPMDTEADDEAGLHSLVVADQAKLVAPVAGILDVVLQVGYAGATGGTRYARIVRGTNIEPASADILADATNQASNANVMRAQAVLLGHRMAPGDVVTLATHQNSGAALALRNFQGETFVAGRFTAT